MKLSPKAQTALDRVVNQFRQGDLAPLVQVARLRMSGDTPASRWTFSNQVLAYAQTGELDCRGYRQWQEAGRQVKKGARAAYILRPMTVAGTNAKGEDERKVIGFATVAVFPLGATEGEDVPDYQPAQLPPLLDVAARLGIEVSYQPLPPDRLGDYDPRRDEIRLGTHDAATFFHELAHAAHKRVDGQLKAGQNAEQETIAELTAAVLLELYGLGDHTGSAWEYIRIYAEDPLTAIVKAVGKVGDILQLLLEPAA